MSRLFRSSVPRPFPWIFLKLAAAGVLVSSLAGCSGMHMVPPADYATTSKVSTKVAFDQDGNIYPRTVEQVNWTARKEAGSEKITGGAFQLAKPREAAHDTYTPAVRLQSTKDLVAQLNKQLATKNRLVILIHGYNNSFEEANAMYELIRSYIDEVVQKDSVLLDVHWDGLVPRHPSYFASPASFWPKALTYSNLAGTHGLRTILQGLDKEVDVRFVTHSRGAAVALSSLINPIYDPHIIHEDDPALDNPKIRSVKILAFAPAVGAGHLVEDINRQLIGRTVELFVGLNQDDIITSKFFSVPRLYGTSELGSNINYVREQIALKRPNFPIRAFEFKHGRKHALDEYLNNAPELSRCMFALVDLAPSSQTQCSSEIY